LLAPLLNIYSTSRTHSITSLHLHNLPIPQLLLDLSHKFAEHDEFALQILSPALSFLLQDYWNSQKEDTQTLNGDGWRSYLAALAKVAEAKDIAALVSFTCSPVEVNASV
jgi:hypothetical protein